MKLAVSYRWRPRKRFFTRIKRRNYYADKVVWLWRDPRDYMDYDEEPVELFYPGEYEYEWDHFSDL